MVKAVWKSPILEIMVHGLKWMIFSAFIISGYSLRDDPGDKFRSIYIFWKLSCNFFLDWYISFDPLNDSNLVGYPMKYGHDTIEIWELKRVLLGIQVTNILCTSSHQLLVWIHHVNVTMTYLQPNGQKRPGPVSGIKIFSFEYY